MRTLAALPLLVGCLVGCFADKAIELELAMPEPALAQQFAPGCVQAVEIWINGSNYPTDDDDDARGCISLPGTAASWDEIHASIRGRFEGAYPDSGLGGVEVYGYAGACESDGDFDLIFFAEAGYTGGDKLVLPVTPNLSCATEDVRVRPIDVLKLVKTGQCSQAAWSRGKMALATLSPYPFTTETTWWGGETGANIGPDGTAAFRARAKVGPASCLATANYTGDWEALSCVGSAEQRVCATGGELEAAMIDPAVATASQDLAKVTRWGALVIGAVWAGTGPMTGATVTLDEASRDLGEIVYFDMPAGVETGVGALTERGGTATGPTGLFGVYTQSLVTVKITANGKTVTRQLGGNDKEYSSAALVKL